MRARTVKMVFVLAVPGIGLIAFGDLKDQAAARVAEVEKR